MVGFGGDEFVSPSTRSRSVVLSLFHAMKTAIVMFYVGIIGGWGVRARGARGEGFLLGQCTQEIPFPLQCMNGTDREHLA